MKNCGSNSENLPIALHIRCDSAGNILDHTSGICWDKFNFGDNSFRIKIKPLNDGTDNYRNLYLTYFLKITYILNFVNKCFFINKKDLNDC